MQADWYHFYKHKTRLLPSACVPEDFARARRRGFLHSVHRFFARPLIYARRRILSPYDLAKTRWATGSPPKGQETKNDFKNKLLPRWVPR